MPAFSLAALTVLDLAPPALIDIAAACGYDAVGIRLLPAMPGGIAYPLDDEASLKETLDRLDATGIKVADLEVVALRPETDIAAFSAFFETGARLGAKHILVAAYDPDLGRFRDSLCQILRSRRPIRADGRSRIHALDLCPGSRDRRAASSRRWGRPMPASWSMRCISTGREVRSPNLRACPSHRLHYWQLCDGPAERPATNEELIHAARHERMFPGRRRHRPRLAGARHAGGYHHQPRSPDRRACQDHGAKGARPARARCGAAK